MANGDKIPTEAGHVGVRCGTTKKLSIMTILKMAPYSIPEIVPEGPNCASQSFYKNWCRTKITETSKSDL